jgi:hypothetical protein
MCAIPALELEYSYEWPRLTDVTLRSELTFHGILRLALMLRGQVSCFFEPGPLSKKF